VLPDSRCGILREGELEARISRRAMKLFPCKPNFGLCKIGLWIVATFVCSDAMCNLGRGMVWDRG
jgi:hypothetical protein